MHTQTAFSGNTPDIAIEEIQACYVSILAYSLNALMFMALY